MAQEQVPSERSCSGDCEALWQEGISPNRRIVQQRMPVWNDHAFGPGIVAWRRKKGLPEQGTHVRCALPTNLRELAKVISPAMASAPLTSYDPAGDGRWQVPSVKVLSYLGRIENPSVRDAMALFALLRSDRQQKSIYNQIANFVRVLRRVMIEQSIEDITSVNANDLLFRIHVGEIGKGLSEHQRRTFLGQWSAVRNAFDEYAERLTPEQLEVMKNFFIGPVTDRRRFMRHKTYGAYLREQQERVKIKTDAVQSKFYQIRHVAGIRCNQLRRLYEATRQAVAAVEANDLRCPYEFSYEETAQTMGRRAVRQRVELTLWDSSSLREHAVALGYHEAPATTLQRRWQEASFSPKNRAYFVEYNATTSLTQGCPAEPFWFLDLFRHRVFRHLDVRSDSDLAERREAFHAEWGYESKSAWADGGLLAFGPTDFRPIDFLQRREGHEFLPYEGIYAACMFGGLVIRMGTITGARVGEIMQIAQSPDCFKQLENVGPKAATRWMLRLVPKGRQKREDYFIDEDTKRHLVELIRFQCENGAGWFAVTAPAGKLKHPSGWFAAGREVLRALGLLSDGAFRLFIYLCLNAERRTGQTRITHGDLAKAVGRSRRSIIIYLEELQRQQVCRVQSATNQHDSGHIEICDAFWPYERSGHTRKLEKKQQHKTGRATSHKSSA